MPGERSGEEEAFSEVLRGYRRAAGLSQEALAERAGLSSAAVAALERGRRSTPRLDTLARLAGALQLGAEDRQRLFGASGVAGPAPSRSLGSVRSPGTGPGANGDAGPLASGGAEPRASSSGEPTGSSGAEVTASGGTEPRADGGTGPGAGSGTGPASDSETRAESGGGSLRTAAADGGVGAPASLPNNLPGSLSSFVGRAEAVGAIQALLTAPRPSTRLLSLVGPGGIGKTRLALEVAAGLVACAMPQRELFADGIWLAELAALEDGGVVPATVAAALGARDAPAASSLDVLTQSVGGRRLLIILDNCEHLIEECARLAAALLQRCPEVRILATSREALAIPGEALWPVPALSVAEPAAAPGPEDVLASEAGRLFVERAQAVAPGFRLDETSAAAVAELCRHLDGIPLAIELGAARVSAFDLHTLVARLADRFTLLRGGNRLALPRHQTLQAMVQWSYDLLSPDEQALFARLAVFAGGFDLDAVEAVAADDQMLGGTAIELLGRLVDKSLVVRGTSRGGGTRYALLETLRQFASCQLETAGELGHLRERHAAHYLAVVAAAEPRIEGAEQQRTLQVLEENLDNLRAALDWSVETDHAAPGLRVARCLAILAWQRGHLGEMDGRLSALLALPSAQAAPEALRANALVWAGYVVLWGGALERARALVEAGLAILRRLGHAREAAEALVWLGLILDAESASQARDCFVEALHTFRELGDEFWIARATTNLGRSLAILGDLDQAIPLLEDALARRRRLADQRGVANTLHHLADATEMAGDLPRARELTHEALSIARAVGDRFVVLRALIGLGRQAYFLGDLAAAEAWLDQALAAAQRDAFGHEAAEVGLLLGLVARDAGDLRRARQLVEDCLRTFELQARPGEAARAHFVLGTLAKRQDQASAAEAAFRSSLRIYRELQHPTGVALAAAALAQLATSGASAAQVAADVLDQARAATITLELHELRRLLRQA